MAGLTQGNVSGHHASLRLLKSVAVAKPCRTSGQTLKQQEAAQQEPRCLLTQACSGGSGSQGDRPHDRRTHLRPINQCFPESGILWLLLNAGKGEGEGLKKRANLPERYKIQFAVAIKWLFQATKLSSQCFQEILTTSNYKKKQQLTLKWPELIFKNYKKEVEILKGKLRIRKGWSKRPRSFNCTHSTRCSSVSCSIRV